MKCNPSKTLNQKRLSSYIYPTKKKKKKKKKYRFFYHNFFFQVNNKSLMINNSKMMMNTRMYFNLVKLMNKKSKKLFNRPILQKLPKILKNLENCYILRNYHQKIVNFFVVQFKKIFIVNYVLNKSYLPPFFCFYFNYSLFLRFATNVKTKKTPKFSDISHGIISDLFWKKKPNAGGLYFVDK